MRKEKTLLIIGLWVVIFPFLGFPIIGRKILLLITGLAIVYISYLFYLEIKTRLRNDINNSKTFIDNIGSGE